MTGKNLISRPVRVAEIVGNMSNGGVETLLINLFKHVDRSRFQFDFIVNGTSTNIRRKEIEELGGRVFVVPPYKKLWEYRKALHNIFLQNHYLIVHSHINTLSFLPLEEAKKCGVPIRIAHSHSTTNRSEHFKNFLKLILRHFSTKYPTDLMACSENSGEWLFGKKNFTRGNITLLHNAIELQDFAFNEEKRKNIRASLNISSSAFVIGTVGRFVKQKNPIYLLNVFKYFQSSHPNSVLLFVGDGPLLEKTKEVARKIGVLESVCFVGSHNNVSDFYSAFDVFVLTSLYEGLPVTLVEAQANGLPCVVSNNITPEALLTNSVETAGIRKKDMPIWEHRLAKIANKSSRSNENGNILKSKGYSIEESSSKLERFYEDRLERLHND